jgi:hypothetical protein
MPCVHEQYISKLTNVIVVVICYLDLLTLITF